MQLRKRKYEKKILFTHYIHQDQPTNVLENLDNTDLFIFKYVYRMTKKSPKYQQAQIKLALSNSLLLTDALALINLKTPPKLPTDLISTITNNAGKIEEK